MSADPVRWRDQTAEELLGAVPGIVWEAGLPGPAFRFVSQGAERILGYPAERWTSEPGFFRDHLHPEDREWLLASQQRAVSRGEGYTVQYRMTAADGRVVWLRDSATVVLEGRRVTGLRGLMIESGDRRLLEEELQQSRKVENVGRLVASVAHDFNNLLMVLGGYADLLNVQLEPDHVGRSSVEEVRKVALRGAALVRQILAFSRKQPLHPRVVDLNLVIGDMVRMLRRLLGAEVEFDTGLDADLGKIRADVGQLEQVVMNLAVNARDAMGGAGRLTVSTTSVEHLIGRDGRPEVGSWALLTVTDTGSGMSAETRAQIFEPFFTTKASGHGTGLGLAIVKSIVEESGGHIEVSSELGVGTTFRLFFPVVQEDAATGAADAALPTAPEGDETVLVVEDEEALRRLLAESLRRYGYTVLCARDAEEALSLGEAQAIPVHTMVLDLVLPGLAAAELAQRWTLVHPETRVLCTSGYAEPTGLNGLLDQGMSFLAKPFSPLELARKIREQLDEVPEGHVDVEDDGETPATTAEPRGEPDTPAYPGSRSSRRGRR
jgi:two-component system, cell cycle sensor histidine kinase and response regulator CckA